MRDALIRKTAADLRVAPNMADWSCGACRVLVGSGARRTRRGAADDFNIARLAVDRHAQGDSAERVALRFLSPGGEAQNLSYAELKRQTDRFANGLRALGIGKGDRVFVLAGRIAPLYVAVLGSLKNGSVVTPLFSAFGPEPIATRIGIAQAQVLVTTEALYRRKIEKIRAALPTLKHVIVVGEDGTASRTAGHAGLRGLDVARARHAARDSHERRRHGAAALHQRHDRHAQGRDPRARRGADALRHRPLRAGPARRRRLLVHRRPRLGDRHLVRHRRAAAARRDQHRRRGGVRRRALVPHPAGRGSHRLVHRADGDPHADEGRPGAARASTASRGCASSPASASR